TELCRSQSRLRCLSQIRHELGLCIDIRMRARACDMPTNQSLPIHLSDHFNLFEVPRYVLGHSESTPRHPARKYDIDYHQHSLHRCIDENISRLVSIAVVRKLEYLIANVQCVPIDKCNRG